MKQIFYAVAAIILLFLAIRLMSKVKDVPEEESEPEYLENEDENEENNDEHKLKEL
ncbi:hypothetical protein AGMMS50239_38350 [Bacteroidia bacterium]|nr:hypothetical protein AGMMS50239_38350 [Bacteroidia bacterium]